MAGQPNMATRVRLNCVGPDCFAAKNFGPLSRFLSPGVDVKILGRCTQATATASVGPGAPFAHYNCELPNDPARGKVTGQFCCHRGCRVGQALSELMDVYNATDPRAHGAGPCSDRSGVCPQCLCPNPNCPAGAGSKVAVCRALMGYFYTESEDGYYGIYKCNGDPPRPEDYAVAGGDMPCGWVTPFSEAAQNACTDALRRKYLESKPAPMDSDSDGGPPYDPYESGNDFP